MIELFSWLTDQMLLRFNQVPRRNYVAFLELLGIRLKPPAPARTAVTFYLSTSLSNLYQIPAETEVATEQTETDPSTIFSTDQPLTIGQPQITHLLTAPTEESIPTMLQDRFSHLWDQDNEGHWQGQEEIIFNERPESGNCFYLVFGAEQAITGNVIALTVGGEVATSIGINPAQPPRRWEAWNGQTWVNVLMQESDDHSKGFSFHQANASAGVQTADIILHLPQDFPTAQFATYQGRWVRCVCTEAPASQSSYSRSPRIMSASTRSIGGTVNATQCTVIHDELVGESNGLPGQIFQLLGAPILPRKDGDHLLVLPPDGIPQVWQEVEEFSESTAEDRHYVIDSTTGRLQFGPLVKEPGHLREQTQWRANTQTQVRTGTLLQTDGTLTRMERQYGAVPPKGATLRMVAYRTGGGQAGNVQNHTLTTVKSAVPYVAAVTNHIPARNGADAESIEDAALRVPRMLRTRDRAVTLEDFEALAIDAGKGAIARSCCPEPDNPVPGLVDVILVPHTNTANIQRAEGLHPDSFGLTPQLETQIQKYLDERRLIGVKVNLKTPEYVGVMVQTELGLDPEYSNPQAQEMILHDLRVQLYNFLNPITGGRDGQGWPFGKPVYPSDVITLIQGSRGVRYLGAVLLYELRKQNNRWVRSLAPDNVVTPGKHGLICSWADRQLRSAHSISVAS